MEILTPCLDRLEHIYGIRLSRAKVSELLWLQGYVSSFLALEIESSEANLRNAKLFGRVLPQVIPRRSKNDCSQAVERFPFVQARGAMQDLTVEEGVFLLKVLTVEILQKMPIKPKRRPEALLCA